MKPWIKILFTFIIVLALLFTAAYLFLIFQGKSLIIKQLEGMTQKKVSIGYFGVTAPLNLQINNLVIEDLAKIDSISVSPSMLGFLTGSLALNNITLQKPQLTYQRQLPKDSASAVAPVAPIKPAKKPPLRLIIKQIDIKDGAINFIDRTVGADGIKITIKDLNFNLTNLYVFPRSVITNFALKGKIPWLEGQEEGKIEAEGWLNLFKKDMQATLKIEDIDGIALYPYYSQWVDLEKARIERAKLNFSSNIQGLNNNVVAECHLELTDIVRRPRPPEETEEKAERIATAVLEIFKALNQGKIVLDFTIRTKMDRPELGFGNIKMAFENKLAEGRKTNGFKAEDVLVLPAKLVEGTFKGLTDLTTAVIGGTISAGKQIGKTLEETLKREKKTE